MLKLCLNHPRDAQSIFFATICVSLLITFFEVSAASPNNLIDRPMGALDRELAPKPPSRMENINKPSDFVPPPPPPVADQKIDKVQRKSHAAPLDLTKTKVAVFKQPPIKKDVRIDKLLKINYNVNKLPPEYYARPFEQANSHLPPVYYESYYLQLAFNAVEQEDKDAIRFFIDKHNLQTKRDDDGDTMLIHAANLSKYNAARLLLAKAANVNDTNRYRMTALHVATIKNDFEMVKILLTMGADFTISDENDKVPLDYALENGDSKIIELYRSYYENVSTNPHN